MFIFDFNWQIQNFLNQFWWQINFLLLVILVMLSYLFRSKIYFLPFTFLELCIWITFLGWLINVIKNRRLKNGQANYYQWPIILISIAAAISIFISPDLRSAAGLWKAYFVEPILFFLVLINVAKTGNDKEIILWSLGISTLIISSLAILQKFSGFGIAESSWTSPNHRRVTSIFTSPNAVGLYLGPIVAVYLSWLISDIRLKAILANVAFIQKIILKLLIITLALLAVLFTVSQGTWFGLLAAIIFLAYFGWDKKWTAIVIAGLMIATLVIPTTRNKILPIVTFQDAAGQNRLELIQISRDYLMQGPKNFILGAGIFGLPQIHEQLRDPLKTEPLIYPHNIFLNFWLEIGLLGLIGFIWLTIRFFKEGFKRMTTDKWLEIGIMSAMVVIIIHGLVDVPYFKNDLAMLFWIIIGLITVNGQAHKKIHFWRKHTTAIILGDKTATWRLWDNKNLSAGDIVDFLETETQRKFATAKIINVIEKPMGQLTQEDKIGHEEFASDKEIYETFKKYYKKPVGRQTIVKIIRFQLINGKK